MKMGFLLAAALVAAMAGPAVAQKSKDTLRIPMTQQIQGISYYLDPKLESVFEAETVYDNLIIFDESEYKFKPLLAKSWKQIDENTLEFELRDDIKFHDGEKLTADDVAYTLNWVVDPKTTGIRFRGNWEFIDRVEKTGPFTVRVISKQPTPYALTRLAYLTAIEAEHAHGKAADKLLYSTQKPVGTSMYKVVNIDQSKGIFLERYQDYNHGGTAKAASNIGKMQLLFVPDAGARVAQFLVQGVDMLRDPSLANAEDLAKAPGVEFTMGQGTSYTYMAIDAKGKSGNKPLTDPRVRRAIMMMIDRDGLEKFLTGGRPIRRPNTMCWEFQAGCDFSLKPYPFDPAGAKKLMAEAGYANGFELEITTSAAGTVKNVAELIANQLHGIGIKASIQPTDSNAYRKKQAEGRIQMMIGGWPGGGNPDVQGTLEFVYAVPEVRDYTGDTEMIKWAYESLSIMNTAERKGMGRKIFDRSTEMAYFTALAGSPVIVVHSSDLSVQAGALGAYGINPQGLRWK